MRYALALCILMTIPVAAHSAPDWFRNAEVYNGWYKAWDAKVVEDKMARIRLVVGAPADAKIVEPIRFENSTMRTDIPAASGRIYAY